MPMPAADRSFTTPAVITCLLYFVAGIPGILANILYLREANKVQRVTGRPPEGKGCLVAMLWLLGLPSILVMCVVLALFVSIADGMNFEVPDLIEEFSGQGTDPSIVLSQTSGPSGTQLTIDGTGFRPDETVVLRFHTEEVGRVQADGDGAFADIVVTVPSDWPFQGQFDFHASGNSSIRHASMPFRVT